MPAPLSQLALCPLQTHGPPRSPSTPSSSPPSVALEGQRSDAGRIQRSNSSVLPVMDGHWRRLSEEKQTNLTFTSDREHASTLWLYSPSGHDGWDLETPRGLPAWDSGNSQFNCCILPPWHLRRASVWVHCAHFCCVSLSSSSLYPKPRCFGRYLSPPSFTCSSLLRHQALSAAAFPSL